MISEINGELVVEQKSGGAIPVFRDYPDSSAILFDSNLTNLDIKITPNFITNRYVDKDNGQYFYIIRTETEHTVEVKTSNSNVITSIKVPRLLPRQAVRYEVKPPESTNRELNISEITNPQLDLIQIIENVKKFVKLPDELTTLIILTDILDIKVSSTIIETFLSKTTLNNKNVLFYSIFKQPQFLTFQAKGYSRFRKRYDVQKTELILEIS